MPWIVPAIVGGSLVSGYLGNRSAERGAEAQEAATEASIDEQRRQFNALMERTQPFTQAQLSATNALLGMEGLPLVGMGQSQQSQGPRFIEGQRPYTTRSQVNALMRQRPSDRLNPSARM